MHRANRWAVVGVAAVALAGAACSKGGAAGSPSPRPSTTAKIAIVSPANGQVFHGSSVDVPVQLSLTGATIVQQTTTHIRPDQGHIHLYLDNQIVSMNYQLSNTIPAVKPGQHILRAEFVASDHLPFNPREFVAITFTVTP